MKKQNSINKKFGRPRVLVLNGDGINCQNETAKAFTLAGFDSFIVHINHLLENKNLLEEFQCLALPGGFSFGDDLGSGQILALKIKYKLSCELDKFISNKKLIIGICNGFQVLSKIGLLPYNSKKRLMTLDQNKNKKFINKWVNLKVVKNCKSPWLKEISSEIIPLPIRHAEGRVTFLKEQKNEIYNSLLKNGQIAFQYEEDVNGSFENIAGLTDQSGLILGLMPHPEAFVSNVVYPKYIASKDRLVNGAGLKIFKSANKYIKEHLI